MLSRATEKVMRLHAKALAQEVGIQTGVVVAPSAECDHLADRLFRAVMYLNGYYLHRSVWRKQEGESAMPTVSVGNHLATFPPHPAPMCKPTLKVQVNGAAGKVVGNNASAAMTVAGELTNRMNASTPHPSNTASSVSINVAS